MNLETSFDSDKQEKKSEKSFIGTMGSKI